MDKKIIGENTNNTNSPPEEGDNMALSIEAAGKFQDRLKSDKTKTIMSKELSIEEIEKQLGFNQIMPIVGLTPSEENILSDDADVFERLYIEELKDYYAKRVK